jgi:hypothetical protein
MENKNIDGLKSELDSDLESDRLKIEFERLEIEKGK